MQHLVTHPIDELLPLDRTDAERSETRDATHGRGAYHGHEVLLELCDGNLPSWAKIL
jgi:hypothetical protein